MTKKDIIDYLVIFLGPDTSQQEAQETLNEITKEVLETYSKNKRDVTPIKEIAEEIFKLCPKCNFIPLAYDYNDGTTLVTDKDFEELYDIANDNLPTNDYCIPFEDDDMKLGDIKKMWVLFDKIIKNCYIRECKLPNYCDYSEYTYYGVWGYNKKSKQIEYHD